VTTFEVIAYRGEDGWWVAECPCLPGCMSQGSSKEEALTNLRTVLDGCLEVRAECQMAPTEEVELSSRPSLPGQEVHLLEIETPESFPR
jgi:predicted RNase H-like HicB family nuclease